MNTTRTSRATLALAVAGALVPVGIAVVNRADAAPRLAASASTGSAAAAPYAASGAAPATPGGSTGYGWGGAAGSGTAGSGTAGSGSSDGQLPQQAQPPAGRWWGQGFGQGSTGSGQQGSSGALGDQGTSGSQGGAGSQGSTGWGRMSARTAISGTPLSSAKGVVLVSTLLPGGEGAGTGITLTSDGTILTNYHVVEGSTSVKVTDSTTHRTYTATVVGHDATHDIAVLRLKGASGLSTAVVNASLPSVGTAVTAVGQGGGQGILYAAKGSVTATNQSITAGDDTGLQQSENLTGLVETNADVVPGYSGGPLLDAAGRVVGIDTAASSGGQVAGYAVPIGRATTIADEILAGQRTATVHIGPKAGLGVAVVSSARVAGAAVEEVVPGTGAARAGIEQGSVITAVDGAQVTSASALSARMATQYPGARVRVTWTDPTGATRTSTVTLGASQAN